MKARLKKKMLTTLFEKDPLIRHKSICEACAREDLLRKGYKAAIALRKQHMNAKFSFD